MDEKLKEELGVLDNRKLLSRFHTMLMMGVRIEHILTKEEEIELSLIETEILNRMGNNDYSVSSSKRNIYGGPYVSYFANDPADTIDLCWSTPTCYNKK